jgi:hypothetical protein
MVVIVVYGCLLLLHPLIGASLFSPLPKIICFLHKKLLNSDDKH